MVYGFFLALHNLLRWLILLAGLHSVSRSWQGWRGKKIWEKEDRVAKTAFVMAMDIQFLLGIILYFGLSPVTSQFLANTGEGMKNKELRFFGVEHFVLMVAALALVHIGSAKIKKADNDESRFKYGAIFFSIALVLILVGIPWARRMLPL
jgi:hypothetical protein